MKQIRDLRGLGEKSEQSLAKIGIACVTDLEEVGAVRAFLQLKQAGLKPSLIFLYALVVLWKIGVGWILPNMKKAAC